jgi:hypothetical protein
MRRKPRRLNAPTEEMLSKRPDNRLCKVCNTWIHKDRFAKHQKSKHGIIVETVVAPVKPTVKSTVNKAAVTSVKQRKFIKKKAEDRFVEPLYERQPRFEGGIRWEQGGSPGLGKRR